MMRRKGGDDDDSKKTTPDAEPIPEDDVSNLGDEIGTRIGEGHDPVEDEIK
ncbi:MAG: hypothetical protein PHS73_04105 [Candidatus Peribacteraceae bacterium]|nr:hypothetical protein [Candidatus Peribacteraceae bacterium]